MRSRFSTFPLALPWRGALLVLAFAFGVLASGCGGNGPVGDGSSSQGGKQIDWKLFGRVPQRLHYLPSNLNPPLKQVWYYNDQALIEFPPAIANGRLYLVNKYSNVRALDADTGKVVWDLRRDRHQQGPPV